MFIILDEVCEPSKGTKYSACVDLKSRIDIKIKQGETVLIPLGIKIDIASILDKNLLLMPSGCYNAILNDDESFFTKNNIPYMYKDELQQEADSFLQRHYFQLMIRSSLSKDLIIANGVGIIDIDYKDEVMIRLHNPVKSDVSSDNTITIKKSQRIAQILLLEHRSSFFNIQSNEQRNGGFGSTN